MNVSFGQWLNDELTDRGWSQSEAARRGGISASTIQQVVAGVTQPGLRLCRGIAKAFDMPQDEVLRRAGLLPMPADATVDDRRSLDELNRKLMRLSPQDRRYIVDLVNRIFPDGR